MDLKVCNSCQHENDDTFNFCECCGSPLTVIKKEQVKSHKKIGVILLICIVLIAGIGFGAYMYASNKAHEEEMAALVSEKESTEEKINEIQKNVEEPKEEAEDITANLEDTGLTYNGKAVYMSDFSVSTSSIYTEPGYNYDPKNLIDLNAYTCWVEGELGSGAGVYVSFKSSEAQKVSGLAILPGYVGIEEAYYTNSYPTSVRIDCDGETFEFNIPKKQINFSSSSSDILKNSLVYLDFGQTLEVNECKVTITGVQEGTHHSDCCVSEMFLYVVD